MWLDFFPSVVQKYKTNASSLLSPLPSSTEPFTTSTTTTYTNTADTSSSSSSNSTWSSSTMARAQHQQDQIRASLWPTVVFHFTYLFPISMVILLLDASSKQNDVAHFDVELVPSWFNLFVLINLAVLVEDGLTYLLHVCQHRFPILYEAHKVHHSFHNVVVWADLYISPSEHLLNSFVFGAPTLLFKMDFVTVTIYQVLMIVKFSVHHSGYSFPFCPANLLLPINELVFGASFDLGHDYHHRYSQCNYGAWTFLWDWIFNTARF